MPRIADYGACAALRSAKYLDYQTVEGSMAVARHETRLSCCKLDTGMCPISIEWRRMSLAGTRRGQRATMDGSMHRAARAAQVSNRPTPLILVGLMVA